MRCCAYTYIKCHSRFPMNIYLSPPLLCWICQLQYTQIWTKKDKTNLYSIIRFIYKKKNISLNFSHRKRFFFFLILLFHSNVWLGCRPLHVAYCEKRKVRRKNIFFSFPILYGEFHTVAVCLQPAIISRKFKWFNKGARWNIPLLILVISAYISTDCCHTVYAWKPHNSIIC